MLMIFHLSEDVAYDAGGEEGTRPRRVQWRSWRKEDKQLGNQLFKEQQAVRGNDRQKLLATTVAEDMRETARQTEQARLRRQQAKSCDADKCFWTEEETIEEGETTGRARSRATTPCKSVLWADRAAIETAGSEAGIVVGAMPQDRRAHSMA